MEEKFNYFLMIASLISVYKKNQINDIDLFNSVLWNFQRVNRNPPLNKGRQGGVIIKVFNRTEQKLKRKTLRRNMPLAEVILWSRLKGRQLQGHKFRRQYGIKHFVIDFYCPELRLALEVDGDSHYKEEMPLSDIVRQNQIEDFGVRFLRFTNQDIYDNLEGVLLKIVERIKQITEVETGSNGGVIPAKAGIHDERFWIPD